MFDHLDGLSKQELVAMRDQLEAACEEGTRRIAMDKFRSRTGGIVKIGVHVTALIQELDKRIAMSAALDEKSEHAK